MDQEPLKTLPRVQPPHSQIKLEQPCPLRLRDLVLLPLRDDRQEHPPLPQRWLQAARTFMITENGWASFNPHVSFSHGIVCIIVCLFL